MGQIDKTRVRLVREAIDRWPSFVLHISRRLTAAADNFRVGEDVRAVKLLRIGIDDLGEFMTWVEEIRQVVTDCGREVPGTHEWRRRLADGAGGVRDAVARSDFAEAADRIETTLVYELMNSGELADRMCDDLTELQEAA